MNTAEDTARPRPDIGLKVLETMQATPEQGMIGTILMPILMVNSMEGSYPVIPGSALHNVPDDKRASDGGYNRGDYEKQYGYYRTVDRGLEGVVSERDAQFHGSLLECQMMTASLKTLEMMRAHEVRVATKTLNSSLVFPQIAVSDGVWLTGDPKKDVEIGKVAMRAKGIMPNRLVFDWVVMSDLMQNPKVQAAVYQLFPDAAKDGTINKAHLEVYFGIAIEIANVQKNTKAPGEGFTLGPIWDKTRAMLVRVRDNASVDPALFDWANPHIGNTFLFNEGQSIDEPFLAEDYDEKSKRSGIIRVRAELIESYTQSLKEDLSAPLSEVYKACGYIVTGVKA